MGEKAGHFAWDKARGELSVDALAYYRENGYVILRGHASAAECGALREEAGRICSDFFAASISTQVPVFKTGSEQVHGRYLLESARGVSCFLEADDKRRVNKIGHALHELVPVFRDFSTSPSVRTIAYACGIDEPARIVQSMYILKNAKVGGQVVPHRDATFVRSKRDDGDSVLGFWWALEDSTLENGCLWAVPGSHVDPCALKFGRLSNSNSNDIPQQGDDAATGMKGAELHARSPEDYVALPMKEGDLILLHGSVLHKSEANTSPKSRHAYSIHVVSEDVNEECWIQRPPSLPFLNL